MFWSIAALMVLAAGAFVLLPLLRRPSDDDSPGEAEINLQVHRSRLRELEAERAAGLLDDAQYQSAREELERALLDDLSHTGNRESGSGRRPWPLLASALVIPAAAILLYNLLGNETYRDRLAPPRPAAESAGEMPSVDEMVARLEQRLEQEPDNARGWALLGRSYMVLNRFEDSARAYARAAALSESPNVDLLLDYAEAVALSQDGRLEGKPAELIRQALQLAPDSIKAHWLTGMLRLQQQDYRGAVTEWEPLLERLEAGSDDWQQVASMLAMARREGGLPTPAATTASAAPIAPPATLSDAATPASIDVSVQLAPELAGQPAPGDTLFIYARAAGGPRMPLAIVRKQAGDLPLTVTLDDSLAMSPAMKLSSADQVVVIARVSRSGSAMTQPGDLIGQSGPVDPANAGKVKITIDRRAGDPS